MHLRPARKPWSLALAAVAAFVLFPRNVLAQDMGLDLSGDDKSKPAKPVAPDAPPDIPPDVGAKPDASAGKNKIDVGEKDVSLEDRVKSVQHKGFYKKNHLELTPHFAVSINDAYYTKYEIGGTAVFHFSDALALGARFDDMIVQTTENVSTAKRELKSRLPVSKPKLGAAADFYWTPVYGKASLFNSIIHFDFFAVAGAGVVISQTSSNDAAPDNPLLNQGPHPAFDLGIGQRYALNEVIAFEWTALETLYTDVPGGTGASQVQRILTLGAGLAFFIPPVRSE